MPSLFRPVCAVPAGFRTLQLAIDTTGSFLTAIAPSIVASTQPNVLCLPSTFGAVAHDFCRQFASNELTRSFALYGVEPRQPDRDVGSRRIERDVDDVVRAADALQLERFALVGCRHGANVAAVLAAKHSERVTRLVLVNGNVRVCVDAG